MSTDWRESFHVFALRVAERLEKGEQSYQGRSPRSARQASRSSRGPDRLGRHESTSARADP
jgi:hypothetical protein